jgi:hypothetical protein
MSAAYAASASAFVRCVFPTVRPVAGDPTGSAELRKSGAGDERELSYPNDVARDQAEPLIGVPCLEDRRRSSSSAGTSGSAIPLSKSTAFAAALTDAG